MRSWYKFFLIKNSKIDINLKRDQNYYDFEKSMDGYGENEHYQTKQSFYNKYFDDRCKIYYNFLKKNLFKKNTILSLGSGRCAPELSLIDEGYQIICSDMEVPAFYDISKKIFGNYQYKKLNVLKDKLNDRFDSIICLSMIYSLEENELGILFNKNFHCLEKNGLFILDPGGCEDNLFSLMYDKIYLFVEIYLISLIYKLFGKKFSVIKKHQGYRFTNKEIIKIGQDNGFQFLEVHESNYLLEFSRSKILSFLMNKIPMTKKILKIFGRLCPYVRMFKFKKINEKNY